MIEKNLNTDTTTPDLYNEIKRLKVLVKKRVALKKKSNQECFDTILQLNKVNIPEQHCPQNENKSVCMTCEQQSTCFILNNVCISRDKEKSKYNHIILCGPIGYRYPQDDIAITVAGIKTIEPNTTYKPLAIIAYDVRRSSLTIQFIDSKAKKDTHVLTYVIEALKIINENV